MSHTRNRARNRETRSTGEASGRRWIPPSTIGTRYPRTRRARRSDVTSRDPGTPVKPRTCAISRFSSTSVNPLTSLAHARTLRDLVGARSPLLIGFSPPGRTHERRRRFLAVSRICPRGRVRNAFPPTLATLPPQPLSSPSARLSHFSSPLPPDFQPETGTSCSSSK